MKAGFCPGWILGSQEPDTLKTTTALLGLLANGGDPALFLEAGSSAEAIEQLQGLSSFMVLVDDTKATSKIQKVLVGGFQNAKKALVGRSWVVPALPKTGDRRDGTPGMWLGAWSHRT